MKELQLVNYDGWCKRPEDSWERLMEKEIGPLNCEAWQKFIRWMEIRREFQRESSM